MKRVKMKTDAGARSRRRILDAGVQLAANRGLAAVSISRLADGCALSKSGVFAHFCSKEALEIALLEETERRVLDRVVGPAMSVEPGPQRLRALASRFVAEAAVEDASTVAVLATGVFDVAEERGPVHARFLAVWSRWTETLRDSLVEAADRGQLRRGVDEHRFAFDLLAAALATTWTARLAGETTTALRYGLELVDDVLERLLSPDAAAMLAEPIRPEAGAVLRATA